MPIQFNGSVEDRLRRLDRSGRRCDAQNRCIQTAVWKYRLLPADGEFNPLPEAQETIKQACSKHRKMFLDRGIWSVLEEVYLGGREGGAEHKFKRHCEGVANCAEPVVSEYILLPADGKGTPQPGAQRVYKKACAAHRSVFDGNGDWYVIADRHFARRES